MIVDFSSGLNLYPDLRLVKDAADEYDRSMARIYDVLTKMTLRINASTASAASAIYSTQCIMRGCHVSVITTTKTACYYCFAIVRPAQSL